MTKEEAMKAITESPCNDFDVRCCNRKRRSCDLCKRQVPRDFVITGKFLQGGNFRNYKLKTDGNKHIAKHICIDCYIRLFPEDLIEKTSDKKEGEELRWKEIMTRGGSWCLLLLNVLFWTGIIFSSRLNGEKLCARKLTYGYWKNSKKSMRSKSVGRIAHSTGRVLENSYRTRKY